MESIDIYTDGACSGNPGIGGWGVLLRVKSTETELFGGEPATTNNRMELRAVIEALQISGSRSKRESIPILSTYRRVSASGFIVGSDAAGKQRAMSPSRMRICGVVSMR